MEELAAIASQAQQDALDEEDARRNRKVLVFSYYEDTVDWIEDFLRTPIEAELRLAVYRGRLALAAGHSSRGGVSRENAVHGFAPESSGARADCPDQFDILVCTDVLAEGMNLQQCRNIINYDLPWNPMRLVQRHGRIGRKHPRVFLRTFFPDRQRSLMFSSRKSRMISRRFVETAARQTAKKRAGRKKDADSRRP